MSPEERCRNATCFSDRRTDTWFQAAIHFNQSIRLLAGPCQQPMFRVFNLFMLPILRFFHVSVEEAFSQKTLECLYLFCGFN